jgi:hypothetical protein
VEEFPCELVREQHFLGSGGSGKAALVLEEGNGSRERVSGMGWGKLGEQGQGQECTQSESRHHMLGKMLLTKKAHKQISCSRAGFDDKHEPSD